jgi:autotransporter-associated beta strand protein
MSGFSGTLWYHNMSGGSSLLLFNAGSASAHFVTDGTTTSGAYNWFFAVSPSPTFYMGELSGTGGTVTAVGDTISLFEVGALNTSATYAGTIGQNGPQVGLNKVGTGTLELSGPNNDAFSYTGTTTVSAGTLWVSGTLSRSSGLTVNDGATLKVTAHGATAAIATGGALTLGSGVGGATNQFVEVSSTGTAPIQAGSLTLTGTTTIDILSGGMLAGQTYPLIGFTTLDGAGNFVLGTLPAGVTATLVTSGSSIALAVTSVLAPPTISGGTMLPGGSFEIMFSGPAGQSFKVLGTNVITAPLATWPVLLNGTFGIGGPVATNFIDSGTATNRLGFYRIVSP